MISYDIRHQYEYGLIIVLLKLDIVEFVVDMRPMSLKVMGYGRSHE